MKGKTGRVGVARPGRRRLVPWGSGTVCERVLVGVGPSPQITFTLSSFSGSPCALLSLLSSLPFLSFFSLLWGSACVLDPRLVSRQERGFGCWLCRIVSGMLGRAAGVSSGVGPGRTEDALFCTLR